MNNDLFLIALALGVIALFLSYYWLAVNRKAHLFAEMRKQFLRDVEYEIEEAGYKMDIFKIDKEVFGPEPQVPKKWSFNKEDEFPPKKFAKDFEKFRDKPLRQYEKRTPLLFVIGWWAMVLYASFKIMKQVYIDFPSTFALLDRPHLMTLIGLSFNFVGAIMIAVFSEHGTSTLWKHKELKWAGYILFICGFGIHIFVVLMNMFG